MEQTSDTKSFEPPRRQISMIEQNKKNKPKKPAQGERSKMGTNGVEEGLEGKKTAVNPDKSSISETCI
ncbi:hypothetical protein PENANT_c044G08376 [Penicillium antarcticum]|uniref:Uncharacterized protein n=1 Tax=Penicillium antarcticum TaxID=416450 RepID=A0A1V6PRY4_9EURO|nr:hypothetical protein PENANT_c044G08376 [Penicillium antarcticum]